MSDFDPTTNRIPFGLLSENEKTALIHWPHSWEKTWWGSEKWGTVENPEWEFDSIYRGKPAPLVTSRWFNILPLGPLSHPHLTLESADKAYGADCRIAVLRIDTCNGVSTAHLKEV